jgi:hypothetical protein
MADSDISTRVDEVAIDQLRDRHVAALNSGDADAWVACFTDDGVQMPPSSLCDQRRKVCGPRVEPRLPESIRLPVQPFRRRGSSCR